MKHIRPAKLSRMAKRELPIAYLLVLPSFLLYCLFQLYPLILSIYRSFFNWSFYVESTFIGLENYTIMLQSEAFRQSIVNVIRFTIVQVPLGITVAFLFANLLRMTTPRVASLVKSAIYIPGIMSGVVASGLVLAFLNYRGGLLNQLSLALGGSRISITRSSTAAFLTIIITNVWLGIGGNTILMYAGLMGIPQEYYEAASLDGANGLQKMLFITLPQMKNIFVLQLINHTSGTLQMFDMPLFISGGGPRQSTLTPMLYLYDLYRDPTKTMSYTLAGSIIMLIVIAFLNSFVFRIIRSEKTMEG